MIKSRNTLIEAIKNHRSPYEIENSFSERFLDILQHPACYNREHLPGHITGSAWIVDETHQHVLLTLHAKLNKWLQPGGHADGDEDILNVALREAEEETGLRNFVLLKHEPFDIDIHTIPARKDFPEHLHFDIRFIFKASMIEILSITKESNDLKWIAMEELDHYTKNDSILRMKEKTLNIL
jgi:8-oxo-dGTP pyrophosphatase MutT (NUDIX family)